MKAGLFKLVALGGGVYLALVLLLAGCQRHMIYYPQRAGEDVLTRQAAASGMKPWLDIDGRRIGWQRPSASGVGVPAVLVFHGNAGHAAHRGYFADAFSNPGNTGGVPWHVYILEYPGYGSRDGRPSQRSLTAAANEALAEVLRYDSHAAVHLVGESLGSGVASQVAGGSPESVDGLLLISPFASLTDVARAHFPWLPVRLVLRDTFKSREALKDYGGPVAVVIAGDDEVIPPRLSERLYESYEGPKRRWVQPGARHNTMDLGAGARWWRDVVEFWEQHGAAQE